MFGTPTTEGSGREGSGGGGRGQGDIPRAGSTGKAGMAGGATTAVKRPQAGSGEGGEEGAEGAEEMAATSVRLRIAELEALVAKSQVFVLHHCQCLGSPDNALLFCRLILHAMHHNRPMHCMHCRPPQQALLM